MIDVTVVVVSYNTRDLTLKTLASLASCAGDFALETIVVDNASSDGSADAICAAFPNVSVARSKTNLGFAQAVNLAASQAQGRYLLLLNPDTVPGGAFIAELVEFAGKHPERGIYGGRTVREDGSDFLAGYGFPTVWSAFCFATLMSTFARQSRLFNPEELPGLDRSEPVPVPALSGCLLLADLELFLQHGGFDPRFFMYGEDMDLCYRATRSGAQPTLVPAARIIHLGGKSSSSAGKVEMLMRGKITFLAKHQRPRLIKALLMTGVFVRAIAGKEPWRSVWRTRRAWRNGWPAV
ncbi:glycosyltransferase family 2 protein [Catelliglobosispora koreensis]|uniref:glycosyltransferase family 2 protein n=1 Tax=Catelliglobosispora koreensis TaxID=129052 RepID=UPI000380881E|nr:glycosyltransferase family 2 protein [Catelliglobosispora koreensis]